MTEGYLFDTCAMIWTSEGKALSDAAVEVLEGEQSVDNELWISPMTAWELGMLMSNGRIRSSRSPIRWFQDFVAAAEISLAPLSPEILIAASFLPGQIRRDPTDRILVATARECGLTLLTRDQEILKYAMDGHVSALKC